MAGAVRARQDLKTRDEKRGTRKNLKAIIHIDEGDKRDVLKALVL